MSQVITFNGSNYTIPDVGDTDWGQNVTDFLVAIETGALQPTGGLFSLAADVDFGSNFGLKSIYYKSRTADIAASGILRLARVDSVAWRNQANSADLLLTVNTNDQLVFNGLILEGDLLPSGQMFVGNASNSSTPRTISGAWTMSNAGVATISNDYIVNAMINSAAAIAFSKMAALTANRVLYSPGGIVGVSNWVFDGSTMDTGVQQALRWRDSGSNYVSMAAPATLSAGYALKWPTTAPLADQFLRSDGAGQLRWDAAAGSGVINSGSTGQLAYYAAPGMTLSGTNGLTYTPSVFALAISGALIGNNPTIDLTNTDNTNSASAATIRAIVGGASGGDPKFSAIVTGGTEWTWGVDNSDSDSWKLAASGALESSTIMSLTTAGAMTLVNGIFASGAFVGSTLAIEARNTDNTNGASNSVLRAVSGGSSGGDPFLRFDVLGQTSWSMGIDNSNSDALACYPSSSLSGTPLWIHSSGNAMHFGSDSTLADPDAVTFAIANNDWFFRLRNNDANQSNLGIRLQQFGGARRVKYETMGYLILEAVSTNGANQCQVVHRARATGAGSDYVYMTAEVNGQFALFANGSEVMRGVDGGTYRQAYFASGLAATPGISFASATGSGMSWSGAGATSLQFSHLGSLRLAYDTTNGWNVGTGEVGFKTSNGSAANPSWSFASDPDTGLFRLGTNQPAMSVNGALSQAWFPTQHNFYISGNGRFEIGNTYITANVDNTMGCGLGTSNRWTAVYAVNGTIQTSHSSQKHDIRYIDDPIIPRGAIFKWKEGNQRDHIGFISDPLPKEAYELNADGSPDLKGVHLSAVVGMLCSGYHKTDNRIKSLEDEIKRLKEAN